MSLPEEAQKIERKAMTQYVQIQEDGSVNMMMKNSVKRLCEAYGFNELKNVIEEGNYTIILKHYDELVEFYNLHEENN